MIARTHNDITLLCFERLSREAGIAHAFVSKTHNYAPHRGPNSDQAIHWRQQVCRTLEIPFERLISPAQVHGGEVIPVHAGDAGCGRDGRSTAVKYVDGLVTNESGLPLVLMSADCPLVFAYDPMKRAIGAVHSSWQGTVAHATSQMIRVMRQAYGCNPADLLAGIAPCAGPCCYEIGEDVRRIVATRLEDAERFVPRRAGKMTLDLWSANQQQLMNEGMKAENIEIARLCTICDERFWSHRRDKETAGRSALFVSLR
jgi:purine-nucleoside/S-methyl-5'-thioadenosine phosphorylase / adenosine deaminase